MVKDIVFDKKKYAIIISSDHHSDGIEFLTESTYSQQLAYMHHPEGKYIDAHIHNIEKRQIEYTQEVLIVRRGKLRVDFYTEEKQYIESTVLSDGDVILLVSGGHGFKVLEELEMIEVKQGPYLETNDKVRFSHIEDENVIIRS